VSTFLHACEGDAVTKLTNEKVPYFNAPIYLQNKTQIGKVDEIFGPINESVSASLPPPPANPLVQLEFFFALCSLSEKS
jgi:H/ACA ribonucleoprotein complex subunit 1